MKGKEKAFFCFLFLFFLGIFKRNLSWKFEVTTFSFSRFEQLNTAQKPGIFKFLFFFTLLLSFILSSRPLPARSLFLFVLHNDVKAFLLERRDL